MPNRTSAVVETPASRPMAHIHLVPRTGTPKPHKSFSLGLFPARGPRRLMPIAINTLAHVNHSTRKPRPRAFSSLSMVLAASAAPLLWLLHAAGHTLHLY